MCIGLALCEKLIADGAMHMASLQADFSW